MKRFYKAVSVEAAEDGFLVRLDGRELRSPAKAPLRLPTRALAEALAGEWDRQGEELKPLTMPLMRLVSTATDVVPGRRDAIRREVAAYGGTDLVCYRADAPPDLVAIQAAAWDPLLAWVRMRYDAALHVTAGVVPVAQPATALKALSRAVAALDDRRLTVLQACVTATGSLVLGLALLDGRIDAAEAARLSRLDESYQARRWGEDWEETERAARVAAEIASARHLLELLPA